MSPDRIRMACWQLAGRARAGLLATTALTAAAVLAQTGAPAAAPPPLFSSTWLAARGTAGRAAGLATAPTVGSLAAVRQGMLDLQAASSAIARARAAQLAARLAASPRSPETVGEGLAPGGLQPSSGAIPGTPTWSGADLPTQAGPATQPTVTVRQTSKQALLTWQSFNVGRHTTLAFDQSAGGAAATTWSVLNKLDDPAASPSLILGSVIAPGQVLVLSRNGILFAAGSQVNVGGLVAATSTISSAGYLATGIVSPSAKSPAFTGATAPIIVEAGAVIRANAPAALTSGGGAVVLLGSDVSNAGQIETPSGQAALAAGRDVALVAGLGNNGDALATVLGLQPVVTAGGGVASNTGLILATDGDATLVGRTVRQAGVIAASTGASRRGTVHLLNTNLTDPTQRVLVAPGSLTYVGIDPSGETVLEAQRITAPVGAVSSITGQHAGLPDFADRSRIEISAGGSVEVGGASAGGAGGAMLLAPGGQIAISAGTVAPPGAPPVVGGVLSIGAGAMLDVAGLVGVPVAADQSVFPLVIEPYNLRDSPVNRENAAIKSRSVFVDARSLLWVPPINGDASSRAYTPGGLLEVSGEVGNIGHTIAEYASLGGTIIVRSATVAVAPGAVLDVAGGSILHAAGSVPQSWLLGVDGRLYSVANAPSTVPIAGLFGGFPEAHTRWNVVETFNNPLIAPDHVASPAYTVGRDAGSLAIYASNATLGGGIEAAVVQGAGQRRGPIPGASGLLATQSVVAVAGTIDLEPTPGLQQANVLLGGAADVPAQARMGTVALAANVVSASGAGSLIVNGGGVVAVRDGLTLQPGGSLRLGATEIDVAADIAAPAATVTLTDAGVGPSTAHMGSPRLGIVVVAGAVIDTRGIWANEATGGPATGGAAYVNGGAVTLQAAAGVTLEAGSTIDTSAGALLTALGRTTLGNGGAITITSGLGRVGAPSITPSNGAARLDGVLRAIGYVQDGAFSLRVPQLQIGPAASAAAVPAPYVTVLAPAFFAEGFSSYTLVSDRSAEVTAGTTVTVAQPIAMLGPGDSLLPPGRTPTGTLDPVLPPFALIDPTRGRVTQRAGASFSLTTRTSLEVGDGAALSVDPGQAITLRAGTDLQVFGTLTAPGGAISLRHVGPQPLWIGPHALLDAAGVAVQARDSAGRPFGLVTGGGNISIGVGAGLDSSGFFDVDPAPVALARGAMLDVSGAAVTVDLAAGTGVGPEAGGTIAGAFAGRQLRASAGGTIALGSYNGVYDDAIMRAGGGGAGAAGGTLSVLLETPYYSVSKPAPPRLNVGRSILVSQGTVQAIPNGQDPRHFDVPVTFSPFSADMIVADGFGSVVLGGRGGVVFDGDVSLALPQSLTLGLGPLSDTRPDGHVSLSAPVVTLSGGVGGAPPDLTYIPGGFGVVRPTDRGSMLAITGEAITVRDLVNIGLSGSNPVTGPPTPTRRDFTEPGFATLSLAATTAVRFLSATLTTAHDVTITAGQVYPETGATATIAAGQANGDKPATVTFARFGDVPAPPLSVFGQLIVQAATVNQGGVLRAPFGLLNLGSIRGVSLPTPRDATLVRLLPGSITSVSAYGLTVPYGGTTDGLTYSYNGQPVSFLYSNADTNSNYKAGLVLQGSLIEEQSGATIDLRGGGDLTGAGFIAGRGGSTDTLVSPLLSFGGGAVSAPVRSAADQIYAVIPGYVGPAPITPLDNAGQINAAADIPLGATISLPTGAAGLVAGSYTLLPASYALLPGAYRLEVRAGATGNPQPISLGNGSVAAPAFRGGPGGTQSSQVAQAIVTPGPTVRGYSQYNEESYSQFATLQPSVGVFQNFIPILPRDGRELVLRLGPNVSRSSSLSVEGTTLVDPAPGGLSATLSVAPGFAPNSFTPRTLIVVPGGLTGAANSAAVDPAQIDNLGIPALVLGGDIVAQGPTSTVVNVTSVADGVTIAPGTTLSAAQIVLTSAFSRIEVKPGATLSTLGGRASLRDASSGIRYVGQGEFLALSQAGVALPPATVFVGSILPQGIRVDDGAVLVADGSLAFSTLGPVTIAPMARLGAAAFVAASSNINLGDPGALDGAVVPPGLAFTPTLLAGLLRGTDGSPPLRALDLTASHSLNIYGGVTLDTTDPRTGVSQLADFVLQTPGIFGYSVPGEQDTAKLILGGLTWNGVLPAIGQNGAVPIGVPLAVAGGPGTGSGTLDIVAQRITFGFPANQAPNDTLALDRGIFGFAAVTLEASAALTFADRSTLRIGQTQGLVQPGGTYASTGGALTIVTPHIVAASNGRFQLAASGPIVLTSGGAAPDPSAGGLGGSLDIASTASITDTTAIVLPSGALSLTAQESLALGPGALIDVSGRTIPIFDQVVTTQGGRVALSSVAGSVTEDAAAAILLGGAPSRPGGSLAATAALGTVALAGRVIGGGGPDPRDTGGVTIDTGTLSQAGFTGLNQALDAGGVFGSRSLEVGAGDLAIGTGDGLRASTIDLSLDAGRLTVAGLVDASGPTVGHIALTAARGLTIAATAALDATGARLALDGYGQVIPAIERAHVTLASSVGAVAIEAGASIALAGGGLALGDLEVDVPRAAGGAGGAMLALGGTVAVTGAATIAVNAFATYSPADGLVTQARLDAIDLASRAFIDAAAPLAHAITALGAGAVLRPGVVIDSAATKDGNLSLIGELDLARYRYGPGASTTGTGAGQPGVLVVRAANNLNVYGSVSDGFGQPPPSPDDNGWVRNTVRGQVNMGELDGQAIVTQVPIRVRGIEPNRLSPALYQPDDIVLNYDLPLYSGAGNPLQVAAATAVPVAVTLARPLRLVQDWRATGTVTSAAASGTGTGTVLWAKGQVIPAGTLLAAGTRLGVGASLPQVFAIGSVTWPAGANLSILSPSVPGLRIQGILNIPAGGLIPGDATLAGGRRTFFFPTRPVGAGGRQGQLDILAPLLPAGTLSWSIGLVSGANLAAADPFATAPLTRFARPAQLQGGGNIVLSDTHQTDPKFWLRTFRQGIPQGLFDTPSVLRTGTGDLRLAEGNSLFQLSPYGIYTAGTQSAAVVDEHGLTFEQPQSTPGQFLPTPYVKTIAAQAALGYQPYYPGNGGDVTVRAQSGLFTPDGANAADVGNWLWRQGSPGRPTAWSINFGTYRNTAGEAMPVGFIGIGALGGGDVGIVAGGDVGLVDGSASATGGLNAAVGATGRVTAVQQDAGVVLGGSLVQTGGGDLSIVIGGGLNPGSIPNGDTQNRDGTLTDVRGGLTLNAGSIGTVTTQNLAGQYGDPRLQVDPRVSEYGNGTKGPLLVLGDASATLLARGDAVLGGVGDAGRVGAALGGDVSINQVGAQLTATGFSLWRPDSAITLIAAGGNLTPDGKAIKSNSSPTDLGRDLYPPILYAAAPSGSIYSGTGGLLELAPSASGQLDLLAGQSLYGTEVITLSGAPAGPDALSNPFHAVYVGANTHTIISNTTNAYLGTASDLFANLFAFESDTPRGPLHPEAAPPVHIYAGAGDVVGLQAGVIQTLAGVVSLTGEQFGPTTWYVGGAPVLLRASRDIVAVGTLPPPPSGVISAPQGGLFVQGYSSDVSVLEAGRDIIYANAAVAGPGLLYVQAGRNVYQGDRAVLTSLGIAAIDPAAGVTDRSGGAGITVLAGVGSGSTASGAATLPLSGVDWEGFARLYLDDANRADPALALADPANRGRVIDTYGAALLAFMRTEAGYTGPAEAALAAFLALPIERQSKLLLPTYFEELRLSGRGFNDPASRFYRSYATGRQAIAALLPGAAYTGGITLFKGSGIRTLFGGDLTLLAPGGGVLLGVASDAAPPATAGLVTAGQGDVDIYSLGSVLLGQSRVFTTFGGSITIWSAQGDINAGRGAKSTVVAQPFQVVYDQLGDVTLSPSTPSTGAGIATLAEVPGTAPGNVDLIAPLGTIDAGEAGIRSSGDINLAALFIANALNIQAAGKVTGVPVIAVPNVSAALAASATAGASEQAATADLQRRRRPSDSIITVEVLGFGG